MKSQDVAHFHRASLEEIQKALVEKEQELAKAKLKHRMGQTKNLHAAQSLRRDVAQLKTIMHIKVLSNKAGQEEKKTMNVQKSKPKAKKKVTQVNKKKATKENV